jgi:hypothetical protein
MCASITASALASEATLEAESDATASCSSNVREEVPASVFSSAAAAGCGWGRYLATIASTRRLSRTVCDGNGCRCRGGGVRHSPAFEPGEGVLGGGRCAEEGGAVEEDDPRLCDARKRFLAASMAMRAAYAAGSNGCSPLAVAFAPPCRFCVDLPPRSISLES